MTSVFDWSDSDTLRVLRDERLRLKSEIRDCKIAINLNKRLWRELYPQISCFGRGGKYLIEIAEDNLKFRREIRIYRQKITSLEEYMRMKETKQ